jgi:hypothetical protein
MLVTIPLFPALAQYLAPVETYDILHGFHGECLRMTGKFRHQENVQTGLGLAANDGRQVDDRNDLTSQIDYAHHVRHGADHLGDRHHRRDFADLEYVDAIEGRRRICIRIRTAQAEQQHFELAGAGAACAVRHILIVGAEFSHWMGDDG